MRTSALVLSILSLLVLATTNADAVQFSFDPLSGSATRQADLLFPAALVAIASIAGALIIVLERKKAKGIWFSNSETLK